MKIWTPITNYIPKNLLTTVGSLITRISTGLAALPAGVAGKSLITKSTAQAPVWDYPSRFKDIAAREFDITILDIGAWDMDADSTVNIPHGLAVANIVEVTAIIRNDAGSFYYPVAQNKHSAGSQADLFILAADPTNITVYRTAGGQYDTVTFDDTGINRGYITIKALI